MCVIVRERLVCGSETTGIRYQTKQTYMFNRVLNVSLKWFDGGFLFIEMQELVCHFPPAIISKVQIKDTYFFPRISPNCPKQGILNVCYNRIYSY